MRPPLSATSLPFVQLEQFDGPLDLLLNEVRRQNVAIEKVAMAPIVARFLDYVRSAADRNLNLDIEWLHMAATLIHWKSRSLLPQDADVEPPVDSVRDELVQQLLAHRKQAAEELARRRAVENTCFSREAEEISQEPAEEEFQFLSVWDLLQQARELAGWVRLHREDRCHWHETFGVEADLVTVTDMIDYLRNELTATPDGTLDGTRLLEIQPTPSGRACLFLGMLEMARVQQLELLQSQTFGSIYLTPLEPAMDGAR